MLVEYIDQYGEAYQREFESEFTIEFADTTLHPTVVEDTELDIEGNTDELTIQCGDTEMRKEGNSPWALIVKGLTAEQQLADIQTLGEFEDEVFVSAPILGDRSGDFIVPEGGLTLKNANDVNYVQQPGQQNKLRAFRFRLELKQPESP